MTLSMFTRRTAAIGAAVIAISGAVAGPALASAPHATAPTHSLVKQGMYVTGFDAAVAKAHGYKLVTYANGDEQAVPINPRSGLPKGTLLVKASAKGGITPDNGASNKVYGNCGDSWIAADQVGPHKINLTSGFDVIMPAASYNWDIQLEDINGISEQGAKGTLPPGFSSWDDDWPNLTQYDFSVDQVLTGSYAILDDGELCNSVGPKIDWDLS